MAAVRDSDVAARVGGDEFAILAVECDLTGAEALSDRLEQSLNQEGVQASIGLSMRNPSGSLADAHDAADQRMYDCKRRRKAARAGTRRGQTAAWR
jgi:diguanylate cyclase (GGDEF)-like protein